MKCPGNPNLKTFNPGNPNTQVLKMETLSISLTVVPQQPKGLKVQFAATSYAAIRWQSVRVGQGDIVYIVRLYKVGGTKPFKRYRMQRARTK